MRKAKASGSMRWVAVAGALLAGLAVALGAFGAHGLRDVLGAQQLGWWQTAAHYHLPHAVALMAIGLCGSKRLRAAAWLLAGGTVVFAGSLYLLALTGWRMLGMITPLGGVLLIVGWLLLAWRLSSAAPDGDS